jgi:hypothetical protein
MLVVLVGNKNNFAVPFVCSQMFANILFTLTSAVKTDNGDEVVEGTGFSTKRSWC